MKDSKVRIQIQMHKTEGSAARVLECKLLTEDDLKTKPGMTNINEASSIPISQEALRAWPPGNEQLDSKLSSSEERRSLAGNESKGNGLVSKSSAVNSTVPHGGAPRSAARHRT
uniref:hypothetical protein n=1 Tax=Paenibacillus dakarensis TaxID=1527293 RepID=UPI000A612D3F